MIVELPIPFKTLARPFGSAKPRFRDSIPVSIETPASRAASNAAAKTSRYSSGNAYPRIPRECVRRLSVNENAVLSGETSYERYRNEASCARSEEHTSELQSHVNLV